MPLRPAVALSLLLLSAVAAHARQPSPAPHPPRHRHAGAASELLAADDLNRMVLGILGGQPQPDLSGSAVRRQRLQAAWARLRGLLGGERGESGTRLSPAEWLAAASGREAQPPVRRM